ncbi:hypothetical protein C6499_16600 [Candidatus Poribacteria bacterium]|nr:MAG: hypothetical protein C6499_16600 [Candidatus Poribacteria bacterium]
MKYIAVNALMLLLFLTCYAVDSQSDEGTVVFDCPDVSSPQFEFDLNSDVIALVMEEPTSDIAPLFKSLDNLYLRSYRDRSDNFKKMVQYYSETLTAPGWRALGRISQTDPEKNRLHLHILQQNETIKGIFVIVRSKDGIYLINIVGEIPRRRLGELLLNLNQLGIEIPELMSLKPRDLEPAQPPVTSTPKPVEPTSDPSITAREESVKPPVQEIPDPTKRWWSSDGKPIHEFRIQSTTPRGSDPKKVEAAIESEEANIFKVLENGSGDITLVLPTLVRVLHDNSRTLTLRVVEEGERRVVIINIVPTQKMSILKSMKISGANGTQIDLSVETIFSPQDSDTQVPPETTRFWAKDAPIHEIHIRGNRKVPETRIRQTLENASSDIDQALKTLFKVMPHFEEVRLQVDEADAKYIATITVDEKPLSTDVYLGFNPLVKGGFNRVTDWELGTRFEVGKRKEIGPLWMWNLSDSQHLSDSQLGQTSRLFGEVSYADGNPHFQYRFGGTANWGKPYIWNLGLTAQMHRLTDAIAPELFPNHNDWLSRTYRIFGGYDYRNYYLRRGFEIALRWEPVMPTHSFKLAVVAESHDSLQKSTDWSATNLKSRRKVRENPPINPGGMRSLTFQYDFNTRANSLGWHNTLFIEHSNPSFGSDFDFTRYQLHLRYAYPLGQHRIRTRLLLGFSNKPLPMQRQFSISGPGGLRGYPLFAPADAAEREATSHWHKHSRYAFGGDRGFLFNIEYHYSLAEIIKWSIFKSAYVIAFLDEGQVWNASDAEYIFDPSGNIGIGLQFGKGDVIWRTNIARALNFNAAAKERLLAEPEYVVTSVWYHVF